MPKGVYNIPYPENEPVLTYGPKTAERAELKAALSYYKKRILDLPMVINGKNVKTKEKVNIYAPHEIEHTLAKYNKGNEQHVKSAIKAAMSAKRDWEQMPWEHRASIFLKAAELIAGPYRQKINATTMLGQSKNAYQAEIDSACEFIDFLRFNAYYMQNIYMEQPDSSQGVWNRLEYRPLEGFVFAVTPFNFTSIAGNLPTSAAMMGNTVVWKPSTTQIYSAAVIMNVLQEAGLPHGVINLIHTDGPVAGEVCFSHPDFAGIHFTGSTGTFQFMWKTIGNNIANYKTYPRIVGETGGKDFVMAHPSADVDVIVTALSRGAFEYQGQKCSAASRAYIPKSLWKKVKVGLQSQLNELKMGTVEDFSNFINAVIDEKAFDNITGYIKKAKKDRDAQIISGGKFSKTEGYFIEPTVIETSHPQYTTMCEEIFGPVLTVYVYDDKMFEKVLDIVDTTSPYALTGAIIAQDRKAIVKATQHLKYAAGNFYINDKPTGAVVNQQPFGGARASGTNDKAGSYLNLLRWVSPRSIKENFVPPKDYKYPFLKES